MAKGGWSRSVLGVALLSMLLGVQGFLFELAPGSTKCVSENIQSNTLVLADYHIILANLPQGAQPKLHARVTSPQGNTLHFAESKDEGQFAFTATESGNYMACFWMHTGQDSILVNIELDWKTGVDAKDWKSIAKREKLEGMELELRRLEDVVESIREEMFYLRDREFEMRNVNENTNARVAWLSIMSLFICLLVGAWQVWHLKSYFERKKLL